MDDLLSTVSTSWVKKKATKLPLTRATTTVHHLLSNTTFERRCPSTQDHRKRYSCFKLVFFVGIYGVYFNFYNI